MSRFNPEDNRFPQGFRSFSRHDDFDDRMYDDRSRSRSADRRRSPPGDKDRARSPRGPAFSRRREYSRDRDSRQRLKSRDRDDFRRWSSRSPPPPRRGRPMYRDRDREDYRSPPHDDRSRSFSRSRSPRRGRYFGQESREVMMDGLPVDMVEEDISNELRDEYFVEGLEEVRVIRDRQTKKSRQLGFLQFRTVSDSRAFLEPNFPSIYFYGPNASGNDRRTRVRIAYSREREDRNRSKAEGDWICRMCAIVNYATRQKCFRCQAPRPESGPIGPPGVPAPKVDNNGDNDAAPENQPSQFLLIRGLESSVTEELLAKGIAKLYRPAPSNNADGLAANQKKVAKVASTTGDSNLGARDGSIRRVLLVRDRKSNESWHYGFAEFATAQDAQAAMARLNSFEKFTISSRPVLVTYIHAGVFVPVMNPTASTVRFTFSPLNNPHLKLMYWDEDAYVTELTVSSAEVDSNQSQSKQSASEIQAKNAKESEKRKRKADTAGSSGAKKLAMPTHLQFWSNRHAELHGIHKKKYEDDKNVADASSNIGSDRGSSPAELSAPPSQSYADLNRNCCYLCMRQFKSSVEVNRHERLSQLHRDNMQKEELKARAMDKLVKHGVIQQNAPEYRDRARERRQAFGSSKKPSGKAKTTAAPPKENEPAQTASKGASLLSKMGWSEGTGLGAHGTGVTAPIATEVYAQGVGLGAQGSKLGDASEEAARNTRNRYDDFLEKTKRTARERYEQMG